MLLFPDFTDSLIGVKCSPACSEITLETSTLGLLSSQWWRRINQHPSQTASEKRSERLCRGSSRTLSLDAPRRAQPQRSRTQYLKTHWPVTPPARTQLPRAPFTPGAFSIKASDHAGAIAPTAKKAADSSVFAATVMRDHRRTPETSVFPWFVHPPLGSSQSTWRNLLTH
jgi:hypothetical protein